MNQLAIDFEPVRARRTDPETSKIAAGKVRDFAGSHYALILAALREGPANYQEIAQRCGLERHAVARRLPEMLGYVERTSEKRNGCGVWRLA